MEIKWIFVTKGKYWLQFQQAFQEKGEIVDQVVTWLTKLAVNFEFHDIKTELMSAIIQNFYSKCFKWYALCEALTCDNLLSKAQNMEVNETEVSIIEKSLPHMLLVMILKRRRWANSAMPMFPSGYEIEMHIQKYG